MKRDMEKVRAVLLSIEAMPGPYIMSMGGPAIKGTDGLQETVEYISMLYSGGLLESTQKSVYRLSWAGHDFLDSVRDPEIWRKTKEGANKAGSWTFGLMVEVARALAKAKIQDMTGLILG